MCRQPVEIQGRCLTSIWNAVTKCKLAWPLFGLLFLAELSILIPVSSVSSCLIVLFLPSIWCFYLLWADSMNFFVFVGFGFYLYITASLAQINLYPDDLTPSPVDLSASCISAINDTVACDSALLSFAFQDYFGPLNNPSMQSSLCENTCGTALASYRKNVVSTCGQQTEMAQGFPVTYVGDLVWSYYNLTCLKDPKTGEWCSGKSTRLVSWQFNNIFVDYIGNISASITTDASLTSLNNTVLCSPCMVSLLRNQQSTAFSGYSSSSANTWASIQSECDLSYPTAVQSPAATPSTIPGFANSSYSATCLSGDTYTVKSGDNCEAIADAHQVATGTLITINQLLPTCSNLQVGQVLCLPDSCSTYKVQTGDTCNSIASTKAISLLQLQTWNPTLNQACTNLLGGANICIGIPGSQTWNGTTISGATATQTMPYAIATVAPQGAVASGS